MAIDDSPNSVGNHIFYETAITRHQRPSADHSFHSYSLSLFNLFSFYSSKMDGLIKGLIDVALGHGDDRDGESDRQSRDERSRSSWAEVSVSVVVEFSVNSQLKKIVR